MSSLWQATIAKADIRLSLFGMPECTSVRPDEAKQGHYQGWQG